jgi:hypothetical protein
MTKQITIKSGEFGEFTKVINVVVQEEWYSIEQCRANPRSIYIFGDNLLRVGEAGQASIRSCNNAIGIATKKKPSMLDSSFFSDKEYDKLEPFLKKEMDKIVDIMFSGNVDTLVFPKDGLGTGFLNAITEKTMATVSNDDNDNTRQIEVSPLTNYNVMVFDQRFNQNSSVTFINTNVTRNGSFRDANVTGLLFDLNNKTNTYNLSGGLKSSSINDIENKNGYNASLYFAETNGKIKKK